MKPVAILALVVATAARAHAQSIPSPVEDDSVELTSDEDTVPVASPTPPVGAATPPVASPAGSATSNVERWSLAARNLARDGQCSPIATIGAQVRAADPAYYDAVFAVDPVIVGCKRGVRLTRAPAAPADDEPEPASTQPELPDAPAPAVAVPQRALVEPWQPDEPRGPTKSPVAAFALSAGTTLGGIILLGASDGQAGPVALGLAALAVGPTVGHIYAGQAWNRGLRLRLVSLGVSFGGALLAASACAHGCNSNSDGGIAIGAFAMGVGSLGYMAGTLWEIGDAPAAASRFNRRRSLAVVPVAGGAPGVTLGGTF